MALRCDYTVVTFLNLGKVIVLVTQSALSRTKRESHCAKNASFTDGVFWSEVRLKFSLPSQTTSVHFSVSTNWLSKCPSDI